MILRPSRHKPAVGDLFVLNMLGRRWIGGRVIRTDAQAFGTDGRLVYFYRAEIDPNDFKTPMAPDLLVPPVIMNDRGWRKGFYLHLRNVPLLPEELLPRHVFSCESSFAPDDPRYFVDEYRAIVAPPEPGLPLGRFGMYGYMGVDGLLSMALGMPVRPLQPTETRDSETEDGEEPDYCVTMYIPGPDAGSELEIDELEEDLGEAIDAADAGRHEGHGTDLRTGTFEIRFYGPQADPMLKAMRPVLARAAKWLPTGWHLTVRKGNGAKKKQDVGV